MLKMFGLFLTITFVVMAVGSAAGIVRDTGEWLMSECVAASGIGALAYARWGWLLFPPADAAGGFDFDEIDEDEYEEMTR